ncbi:MAG: uncharacterized protein A8A55_2570 [Amphiamblys sp. WSBS2006]|nr:MAG: uncharacterized protein A8A55_2570 [Amphiamblys sp. WSBS2006]
MGCKDAKENVPGKQENSGTDTGSGNKSVSSRRGGPGNVTPAGDYAASRERRNEKKVDGEPAEREEREKQEVQSWADDIAEDFRRAEEQMAAGMEAEEQEATRLAAEEQEAARMEAEEREAELQAEEKQKAAILAGKELLDTEMGEGAPCAPTVGSGDMVPEMEVDAPCAPTEEDEDTDMDGAPVPPTSAEREEEETQKPLELVEAEGLEVECVALREAITNEAAVVIQLQESLLARKRDLQRKEKAARALRKKLEARVTVPNREPRAEERAPTGRGVVAPTNGEAVTQAGGGATGPKRSRVDKAKEALAGLLNPKSDQVHVMTVSAKLQRAPLGATRRRLENLGARGGDIAHLGVVDEKVWFTGDARGLAKILETLKEAGAQAERHFTLPDKWTKELRERLECEDVPSRKKKLIECALRGTAPGSTTQ